MLHKKVFSETGLAVFLSRKIVLVSETLPRKSENVLKNKCFCFLMIVLKTIFYMKSYKSESGKLSKDSYPRGSEMTLEY